MNKINKLFAGKKSGILSVYFTAGYPQLNDTQKVVTALMDSGVDMIELGIPFSDPLADGTVIQGSNEQALRNGISLELIFQQLAETPLRVPVVLMGYINPILCYGMERFVRAAAACGIAGVIIPDLPVSVYEREYRQLFEAQDLPVIFLITPDTTSERIRAIDGLSNGFIYMVTTPGTTGREDGKGFDNTAYFERVHHMNLRNPLLAGFGISRKADIDQLQQYVAGVIVGSAYIKALQGAENNLEHKTKHFINQLRHDRTTQ
ncbi:MAG: tryptophan synthase subunit alpha [Sphingobacteriales bacterium]|nr:MAG: tryptophan synthase subunit alpha [Sphingobacteriales bacterium]